MTVFMYDILSTKIVISPNPTFTCPCIKNSQKHSQLRQSQRVSNRNFMDDILIYFRNISRFLLYFINISVENWLKNFNVIIILYNY